MERVPSSAQSRTKTHTCALSVILAHFQQEIGALIRVHSALTPRWRLTPAPKLRQSATVTAADPHSGQPASPGKWRRAEPCSWGRRRHYDSRIRSLATWIWAVTLLSKN